MTLAGARNPGSCARGVGTGRSAVGVPWRAPEQAAGAVGGQQEPARGVERGARARRRHARWRGGRGCAPAARRPPAVWSRSPRRRPPALRSTCSVSVSPVMKITGRCASSLLRFMRRQVSKPFRPGITASMSTRSGVICSISRSALSPSVAMSTVKPARSSVSVRKPERLRRVVHHQQGVAAARYRYVQPCLRIPSSTFMYRLRSKLATSVRMRLGEGFDWRDRFPSRAAWPGCPARGRSVRAGRDRPRDGANARAGLAAPAIVRQPDRRPPAPSECRAAPPGIRAGVACRWA